MMSRGTIGIILRWILTLPGALLAGAVVQLVNDITARPFINTNGILYQAFRAFIAAGVFVYVATRIAPSHPVPTAIVAAVIYSVWMAVSMLAALSYQVESPVYIWIVGISGIVGACGTCMAVYYEDRERLADTWSPHDF